MWQSLGNRASKAQFINQKNLKKFEVSCTSRNTQKQISEIPETTQIRGRERAHLTSAWPGLAQRCLGRARPGFSSEFFLMSSWCGLGSSLMSSSLMGRAQPGFFFFFFSFVFFSDVSFYNGYKSSLRDSIFMQLPRGKNATSDMIRPWK